MTDMTPEEPDIAEMMEALIDDLSEPPLPENREQRAVAAQRQVDAIVSALTRSLQKLGEATSTTKYLALTSVSDTLRAEIGGQLAAADWASLAKVCKDEREAFNLLSLVPQLPKYDPHDPFEPPFPGWTITLRRCTIKDGRLFTEYTRPDRPDADGPTKGIVEYRLSKALAFLRSNGIERLEIQNHDGVGSEQFKWLANAVRKIFIDCQSRLNLVVKATICIPARNIMMYTHLSFSEPANCQIRFEPAPGLVVFSPLTDLQLEKSALVSRYELKEITELDGAVWTPVELDQLASALAKVPSADKVVLRGLTFVRKKTSPEDNEATSEAGSYRFTDRAITLLDAGFSERDYGFIGIGDGIGPYSHWTILHEVGHAVEKYRWEIDYRQWDTAAIERDLSRLKDQEGAGDRITELTLRRAEYTIKQMDMVDELKRNKSSSKCLQAFVSLVGEKKISPCTGYAYQSWKAKHGEFFAEAYSLFLNDPWYIRKISESLYDWFATGSYRASWH